MTVISSFQKDIMTLLPSHYSTFVDVMEFHDASIEVITSLATVQFNFDIVSVIFKNFTDNAFKFCLRPSILI